MLALLGVNYTRVPADRLEDGVLGTISRSAELPVLEDGDLILHEADAILAYLARRYDARDQWLPADDPVLFGQVMMWLSFATDALRPVSLARRQALFGIAPEGDDAQVQKALSALRAMEDHMAGREQDGATWFVGDTPTVADVALFPSFALCREAGIPHDDYPALRRWLQRFRALPGFRTMQGIPDYDGIDGTICPRKTWKI